MLRGLFDFRNDQWAASTKLSDLLSPRGFAANPYWTSRDNMLAECLPAVQARVSCIT